MQLSVQRSLVFFVSLQMLQCASSLPIESRSIASATTGDILKGPVLTGVSAGASTANKADPSIAQSLESDLKSALPRSIASATTGDILKGPVLTGVSAGASTANKADPSIAQTAENDLKNLLPREDDVEARQLSGIADAAEDLFSLGKAANGAANGDKSATSIAKATDKDQNSQTGVDGIETVTRRQLSGIADAAEDLFSLGKAANGAANGDKSATSIAKATDKDQNSQTGVDGIESVTRRQLSGIADAAEDLFGLGKAANGAANGDKSATSIAKATDKEQNSQTGVDGIETVTRRQLSGIADAAEDLFSLGKAANGAANGDKSATSIAKATDKDQNSQTGVDGIESVTRREEEDEEEEDEE